MERKSDLKQKGKNEQQVVHSFYRSKRNSQANEEYKISTRQRKSIKSQRIIKSTQYHKSIAKQRRQQKISIARQSNHISYIHLQMDKLSSQLNTRHKRQQLIKIIMQKMKGNPNNQWRQAMNQLLWAIKCLYMNKQMNKLMISGVVDKLCLTLDKRFIKQNLWHKGAYLLEKIAFLQPKVSEYIVQLVRQGKKGHIVVMAYQCTLQQETSLTQLSNCIDLIATMMSTNCELLLNIIGLDNALMYGIKWLQRVMIQGKSIEKPLSKVYRYLIYLARQISQSWTSFPKQFRFLIKKLMQTLNQTVQFHQSHENHQKLIIIISTLTQYTISIKASQSTQQQSHLLSVNLLSVNLPVCIIVISLSNLMNKIIDMTLNQLKQTAKMVIKMIQISTAAQNEDFQLGEILKRHIQGQRIKRQKYKQHQTHENNTTTTRTISIINNFISYLLIVYQPNHKAKQIIIKIQQFFKLKIQEIFHSKCQQSQENPNLDDTQSNIHNSSTNNRDVQI